MKVWEDGILGVNANLLSDDSKNYVAIYYDKEYRRTDVGAAGGEMFSFGHFNLEQRTLT